MTDHDFLVIAHRGASSYAPENTFAAFDLALEMGANHFELDVHSTSDDRVAVIHDARVDRTTNGTGLVTEFSMEALMELDAGSWFGERFAGERIRSFPEVIERYRGRAHLHTEIKGKSPGLSHRVVEVIRKYGVEEHITITSFQRESLEEVRAIAPELSTGWLVHEVSDTVIATAASLGLTQVCPNAAIVDGELVQRLHRKGFVVRAWGVRSEDLMSGVVKAGADGMTVNFPDKLLAYLGR